MNSTNTPSNEGSLMKDKLEYPSIKVASYIANICEEFGYHINNTKIQKLLYCCYGSVLAVLDQRLCDEYPRAWQYGPVYPRVFKYINKKGISKLLDECHDLDAPEEVTQLIKETVRVFGKFSASSLSDWTHRQDSPWYTALHELDGEPNGFIPDSIIQDYFSQFVKATA